MKKIAILCSLITVAAVSASVCQFHAYNQQVRRTLENENDNLRQAMNRTENLVSGHEQKIAALESELKLLTNPPAGALKTGNS